MSFAQITQRITGHNSCIFDFSTYQHPIGAFVYGLQQFSLVSPSGASQPPTPQTLGLSYTVTDGTGVGYPTVELVQHIASELDVSNTYAEVTVLAYLGDPNPPNILLGNAEQANGPKPQVTPLYPPTVSCAALAGLSFSFTSDSNELWGIGAGAGMTCIPDGTSVAPVGFGAMLGGAGYSTSVDVGYIVLGTDLLYTVSKGFTTSSSQFDQTFDGPVSECAVLIQSFYAQFAIVYPDDSYFDSLTVSASGLSIKGNTVSGKIEYDYLGHYFEPVPPNPPNEEQTPVTSTVGTVLVVGIP
jgi:hypothetical protein